MDFEGRVAIVTGAGSPAGIGVGYAEALVERGAHVVLVDVDQAGLDRNVALLGHHPGTTVGVRADITDEVRTAEVVADIVARFGRLDILVNNAALHLSTYGRPCTELPLDQWRQLLEVNVTAPRIWAEAVKGPMAAGGGGVIVNQSSMAILSSRNAYSVSKAAISAMTIALARELGDLGIRVVGIAPGAIDTGAALAEDLTEERMLALQSAQCLKRQGHVNDLIGAFLFLCSDEASFVTGEILAVTGGARCGFAVAG